MTSTQRLIFIAAAWSALISPWALAGTLETNPAANQRDPDFVIGKEALERKNWALAVEALNKANKRLENADLHSYLGYAYRHLDDLDRSFSHYRIALSIEPNHRGAHEYAGEAYLKVGKLDKALEHLAQLEQICGKNCDEYLDLSGVIPKYQQTKK